MNYKRIFGIATIVIGLTLVGGAAYIQILIDEGKGQILDAEKKIEEGFGFLNIHPLSRRLSKKAEEKAKGKLEEATTTVAKYEKIALYGFAGGAFLAIVGSVLVAYSKKKKPFQR